MWFERDTEENKQKGYSSVDKLKKNKGQSAKDERDAKEISWKTKENMENSAVRSGSAGNRGRICTGSSKIEEDHHKSDPENERR